MKIINIDVDSVIKVVNVYDTVSKTTTSINSNLRIPTGNYNSVLLNFNFISPQANKNGLRLFAEFNANFLENPIPVEITSITAENTVYNTACYVPYEALNKVGKLSLGIFGFILNADNTVRKRLALNPLTILVEVGSYYNDYLVKLLPTASVFEVYFNKIKNSEEQRKQDLAEINESIDLLERNLEQRITTMKDASPLIAESVDDMVDTTKLYVNVTDGYLYYHNGTTWIKGSQYQIAQSSDVITELEDRIKLLEGKRAVQTVIEKNVITETYDDNSYKITTLNNSKLYEKWYSSDDTLIFSKTTTFTGNSVTEVIN